ncbi:MAG: heme lyase CcmF/NrfE family subunit [Moraxellaceae bacterium]|nr:heme lyase CcmF/NrfE family subunit [Moraxellaceae bacterium]
MIPELGHFALILALVVTALQGVLPLIGAHRSHAGLMAFARPAAGLQFALVLLSFLCLMQAFIVHDFSVQYVAMHSNSALPLIYRITAVWGSHEGSLLLWALMLALWTVAVAMTKSLPEDFTARVLGVLGLVSVGFLSFMLFTSNPFDRLIPGAIDGRDLNPLLQDPGMIIHPPLLYMGYVGFSVAFAFAIAALLGGRLDAAWARWSRPWTTAAWIFLTIGIALGSGWAYYELGWGGWWFWDPVENASFMPWLVGTALIHSLAVTEKRGAFKSWTVLLAIAAFSLSLLGTFLVRSGVLTSVHAFATDPRRGVFILGLLIIVIGGSLLLYAIRAPKLAGGGSFDTVSRETMLLTNNVLLSVVAATVLLGTLYPLFLDALKLNKISVGPPYFEAVFMPLMVPVVVLMMVGPFVRWKGHALTALLKQLLPGFGASIVIGLVLAFIASHVTPRTVIGLAMAAWVFIASGHLLWDRLGGRWARVGSKLSEVPRAWWGMWLAHLGIGVFIVGVTLVNSLESNLDVSLKPGQSAELAGYSFLLKDVQDIQGPNYTAGQADIALSRDGVQVGSLHPEKRFYTAQQMPMTEASIDNGLFRDVYVSLGEKLEDGSWIVRLYYKPFISFIWFGCVLMALGGIFAATDARYRRQARRESAAAATAAA